MAETNKLGASVLGIDNCMFQVGDFERARHFYSEVLGFEEEFVFPTKEMVGYQIGGEVPGLGLSVTESPSPATLWVEVPNASTLFASVPAEVKVLGEPFDIPTGKVFVIEDEWGNRIGFTDYCHHPEMARKHS